MGKRLYIGVAIVLLVAAVGVPVSRGVDSSEPRGSCSERLEAVRERTENLIKEAEVARDVVSEQRRLVTEFHSTRSDKVRVTNAAALARQMDSAEKRIEAAADKVRTRLEGLDCDKPTTLAPAAAPLRAEIGAVYRTVREYRAEVRTWIVSVRTALAIANRPTPSPTPRLRPPGTL